MSVSLAVIPLMLLSLDGALGDKVQGIKSLDKAIRDHNSSIAENVNKPYFDSLRKETGFHDLLKEIGLE